VFFILALMVKPSAFGFSTFFSGDLLNVGIVAMAVAITLSSRILQDRQSSLLSL